MSAIMMRGGMLLLEANGPALGWAQRLRRLACRHGPESRAIAHYMVGKTQPMNLAANEGSQPLFALDQRQLGGALAPISGREPGPLGGLAPKHVRLMP